MLLIDLVWYINIKYGLDYFDVIVIELLKVLKCFFFNMFDKREKNFIVGLFMGGYGVYKIVLLINCFFYVVFLLGVFFFDFDLLFNNGNDNINYWLGIFGDLNNIDNIECYLLRCYVEFFDMKIKFYVWCGYEDFFFEVNEVVIDEFC